MFEQALDDENDILRQLAVGDETAFARIYKHYHASVYSAVLHLLISPQLADDVTQEIFIKVWEKRTTLPSIKSFRSYLFIVTRNHSLNVLKIAARNRAGLSEILMHAEKMCNNTEEGLISQEYLSFINQKLSELPPRSREIFTMCREQSKTYDEVARELGITRDAVKSRMTHAMKTLRTSVEKQFGLPLAIVLAFLSR